MTVLLKDWWAMPHRALPHAFELDNVSWKIVEALQHNARLSYAELGRKVGLSTPAAAERVRRLEEAGIITGYHASLDLAKLGMPIRVLVHLTIHGGDVQVQRTVAAVKELVEVGRCHRITGAESFILEANVVSIRHLEAFIDKLSTLGATSTSTVLSSPVQRREYHGAHVEAFNRYL
jgi:Lrp/AsnC family transcriptional regulator, leucine-responsive regulatory protein